MLPADILSQTELLQTLRANALHIHGWPVHCDGLAKKFVQRCAVASGVARRVMLRASRMERAHHPILNNTAPDKNTSKDKILRNATMLETSLRGHYMETLQSGRSVSSHMK